MNEAMIRNLSPEELGRYAEVDGLAQVEGMGQQLAASMDDLVDTVQALEVERDEQDQLWVNNTVVNQGHWGVVREDIEYQLDALCVACRTLEASHPIRQLEKELTRAFKRLDDLLE